MVNLRLKRSGHWLGILLATVVGISVGSGALVWTRTHIVSLHYRLTRLGELETHLRRDVEKLRLEAAALASPRRIEAKARALGLGYPKAGQVVHLSALDVASGAPE